MALVGGPLLGLLGFARAARLEAELDALAKRLAALEGERSGTREPVAPATPEPEPRAAGAPTAGATPPPRDQPRPASLVAALAWLLLVGVLGRYVWIGAGRLEEPRVLLLWLGCYLTLATLARERSSWAGCLGIAFAWLAAGAWLDGAPVQGATRLLVVLAVAGVGLAGLLQRSPWRGRAAASDLLAQATLAGFLWYGVQRALLGAAAAQRPLAALGLAFVYVALALTSRHGGRTDRPLGYTLAGIASVFVGLAATTWIGLEAGLALVAGLGVGVLLVTRLLQQRPTT